MLLDNRILQQHGAYAVLTHRTPIHWADGSTIDLHHVHLRGRDERYLRALQYDRLLWLVVDVRDMADTLITEIPALPWSDTDGLVMFTLRHAYRDADALRARAVTRFKAGWTDLQGMTPRLKAVATDRAMDAACWQRAGAATGVLA